MCFFCIILQQFYSFITFLVETFSTVRVYEKTDTKNNAEVYCETNGAVLLGYSKELIEASIACSLTDVLVNKPWLQRTGWFTHDMYC